MDRQLRIGIVAGDLSNQSAGTTYAVKSIARNLSDLGQKVTVFSCERCNRTEIEIAGSLVRTVPLIGIAPKLMFAPQLASALKSAAASLDCLLVQGFWLHYFYTACMVAYNLQIPVILSPHGMFSDYSFKNNGRRKRLALALGYRRALEHVSAFHATSAAEANDIRRLGLSQPVHLIPNGIDVPELSASEPSSTRTILSLGRLHPKKGLPMLLKAWKTMVLERPDWHLQIAGPDEGGHLAYLLHLVSELAIPRVHFTGPLFDEKKQHALQCAELFVLPSYDENFGLVVAEALAAATPVVTTDRTPWSQLEKRGCGWCVAADETALRAALLEATAQSKEKLADMGRIGRTYVRDTFSWPILVAQFVDAIRTTAHLRSN